MAFIEKMGDTLFNMGKDVSQKAKDMSGIAKLKLNIRAKEDFVKAQYMEIGKAYYERHRGEEVLEQERFDQIDEALEAIEEMELQILELKGARKCPGCGAETSDTAEYCSVCGTKLSAVVKEEPEEEKDIEMELEFGPEDTAEDAELKEEIGE